MRRTRIGLAYATCTLLLTCGCQEMGGAGGGRSGLARCLRVTYRAEVTDVAPGSRLLNLWLPLCQDNRQQEVRNLRVNSPYPWRIVRTRPHGNLAIFSSIAAPPRELSLGYTVDVRRWEDAQAGKRGAGERPDSYALEANRLIPLDPDIAALAAAISAGRSSPREKAEAFYQHVLANMVYDKSGTGWGRGDFAHARAVGRGNCTDYHAFFIGLCRNAGIPAYFETGLSIPEQPASGEAGGYHCWAYFRDGDSWVPVDISEADKNPARAAYFFGNHDRNRVAFSRGRDIVLGPAQEGGPLNMFNYPHAEVDGAAHGKVKKITTYQPLQTAAAAERAADTTPLGGMRNVCAAR